MARYFFEERTGSLIGEDLTRADFRWINFSGLNSKFPNPDNKRFSIVITDLDLIEDLKNRGWNVRVYIPKENTDPDFEPIHHVPVQVKFRDRFGTPLRGPEINLWSKGIKTKVGEDYCTAYPNSTLSPMDETYFESAMLKVNLGRIDEEKGYGTAFLAQMDCKLPTNIIDDLTSKWVNESEE